MRMMPDASWNGMKRKSADLRGSDAARLDSGIVTYRTVLMWIPRMGDDDETFI